MSHCGRWTRAERTSASSSCTGRRRPIKVARLSTTPWLITRPLPSTSCWKALERSLQEASSPIRHSTFLIEATRSQVVLCLQHAGDDTGDKEAALRGARTSLTKIKEEHAGTGRWI